MKKIICCMLIVLFAVSVTLFADEFKSLDEAQTLISKSVNTFSDGKFQEGMDMIKPYWNESPDKIDKLVEQTKPQWDMIDTNYGKKIGLELIDTQMAGTSLAKFTYMAKFEKCGLRFIIILYRNNDGWTIVNYSFDDQISNLF